MASPAQPQGKPNTTDDASRAPEHPNARTFARAGVGFHLQRDQDLVELGVPEWVVVTRAIGHDPWNRSGANFEPYTMVGAQVVCRLTHGAFPQGTLPFSQNYGAFARRCANFVAASHGCHIWIIGNEPNFSAHWPALQEDLPPPEADLGRAAEVAPNVDAVLESNAEMSTDTTAEKTVAQAPDTQAAITTDSAADHAATDHAAADHTAVALTTAEHAADTEDADFAAAEPDSVSNRVADVEPVINPVPAGESVSGRKSWWRRLTGMFGRDVSGEVGENPQASTEAVVTSGGEEAAGDDSQVAADPPARHAIARKTGPSAYLRFGEMLAARSLQADAREWGAGEGDTGEWDGAAYGNGAARQGYLAPEHAGQRKMGYAEVITPRKYVGCYRLCRRAIRSVPGHENDLVLVAGLAPWTNHATYAANPEGDWVDYFDHVIGLLSEQECDGIALHLYTPPRKAGEAVPDARIVGTPYSDLRDYARMLGMLPAHMQSLPFYVTECGPLEGWESQPTGWLERFFEQAGELFSERELRIAMWCLAHQEAGRWQLNGGVVTRIGLSEYLRRWQPPSLQSVGSGGQGPLGENDEVLTTTVVNLRRTPGYLDKPADDVIAELTGGVRLKVLSQDATVRDGLRWWRVQGAQGGSASFEGWIAETSVDGLPLLSRVSAGGPDAIGPGTAVRALMAARIRRTPGYLGKPDNDVLGEAVTGSVWAVLAGPSRVDDLTWWEIEGESTTGALRGWVAETAPGGLRLFAATDAAPPEPDSGGETEGGAGPPTAAIGKFRPGDRVITLSYVRMRRTPGIVNKPPEDVIADVWVGVDVLILQGPEQHDSLIWYRVETQLSDGALAQGWMAETAPGNMPLLGMPETHFDENFEVGELVSVAGSPVRVRRSPGVENKPDDDVLGEFVPRATLNVLSNVQNADAMRWWRVGGITPQGAVRGWVAQSTPQGLALVRRPAHLPGTTIPDRAGGAFLHRPFAGRFGISQLWGENVEFYSRYTYDGVALLGHNGIDFLTPLGTPILATESGVVSMAGHEPGGFGNYVVLDHAWGQSVYAHLDSSGVAIGQSVGRGHELGRAGTTGNSTGPHLHFAIRVHPYMRTDGWGGFTDPLPYMAPADVILPAKVQDEALQAVLPQPMLDLINVEPVPPPGMAEETPDMLRP